MAIQSLSSTECTHIYHKGTNHILYFIASYNNIEFEWYINCTARTRSYSLDELFSFLEVF